MTNKNLSYDIFPKVLEVGKMVEITIHPFFEHCTLKPGTAYQVRCHGMKDNQILSLPVAADNRDFRLSFQPEMEQEYCLSFYDLSGSSPCKVEDFRVYAVAGDWIDLRPYKGDFHIHSMRSDGKEQPSLLAALHRQAGFDFMALTDHRRYAPSLEVISAFADIDMAFRIYPGEEVHPPDNRVHLLNFGGDFSVNDWMNEESEAYQAALLDYEKNLPEELRGSDRKTVASCLAVYDKIRESGGLSLFCHPYWITGDMYNVSEAVQAYLYQTLPFDALELIGGFYRYEAESNFLQVSRYMEERAKGNDMPVVGVSDSHGCIEADLFDWYYTIVLSPNDDFNSIRDSIRARRSVAVEAMAGEKTRVHGPFRLVSYVFFLLREILPLHQELCVEEGRLMRSHLCGDTGVAEQLHKLKPSHRKLYDRLWC